MVLLYGCITWILTKRMTKKPGGNYTKIHRVVLNKSWKQHLTKQKMYGHLPPISRTIHVRWTRYAGYCWGNKNKLINDVLLWTPIYERASVGRLSTFYIHQLCSDTECSLEDLPGAMNDRDRLWERVWEDNDDACVFLQLLMKMTTLTIIRF